MKDMQGLGESYRVIPEAVSRYLSGGTQEIHGKPETVSRPRVELGTSRIRVMNITCTPNPWIQTHVQMTERKREGNKEKRGRKTKNSRYVHERS
jgi:hypothetical protein